MITFKFSRINLTKLEFSLPTTRTNPFCVLSSFDNDLKMLHENVYRYLRCTNHDMYLHLVVNRLFHELYVTTVYGFISCDEIQNNRLYLRQLQRNRLLVFVYQSYTYIYSAGWWRINIDFRVSNSISESQQYYSKILCSIVVIITRVEKITEYS